MRSGYASSANSDPPLLSAYSQYGSPWSAVRAAANHPDSRGVVVVSTNAGSAIRTTRMRRRSATGVTAWSRRSDTCAGAMNSVTTATPARTRWTIGPQRPSRVIDTWPYR
jgi:hypothetical protein